MEWVILDGDMTSFNCGGGGSSGLFKNVIGKMFKKIMFNHLTMCKQIADVGLNCESGVWNRLIACG